MNKLLFPFLLCFYLSMAFLACKKNTKDPELPPGAEKARSELACTYETLSGNISANRTLTATTTYKLDGCVTVKSGATLTIPAGTLLLGLKTPTAGGKSALIVEKGARLNISGTPANPVIFTSDQPAGSRRPGDWVGLRIFGQAPNNNANALSVDLGCSLYLGGGTINTDNSGSMQYFQVHYAGAQATGGDFSQAGIMLNSVGTGTVFDHVQVTNTLNDAMAVFGGLVKLANVAAYNTDRTDFRYEFGYKGNSQFLAAMRLNNTAIPSADAFGIYIVNNRFAPGNSPVTIPVISNATVMGPNSCNAASVNASFKEAVRIANSAGGKIYNNVLSAWNTALTPSGFNIDNITSIAKTATNDLEFSYNSFNQSGATPYKSATWSTGCESSMAQWITGSGLLPCDESGNQFSVSTLGYNSSFCANFCSGFTQSFTLDMTTLSSPNYSWDAGGQFSHPNYRGAFGATDWTLGWTDWCPGNRNYCN